MSGSEITEVKRARVRDEVRIATVERHDGRYVGVVKNADGVDLWLGAPRATAAEASAEATETLNRAVENAYPPEGEPA